jgi:thioredoxin-related protein
MLPSRLLIGFLAVPFLAAQDSTAPAPAKAETWFADFDQAVEAATAQKKDLLVDFTGSDWCGWCIKLHEEVFAHDSFVTGAQQHFVLVALDFPRGPAAKAKVPNAQRNQELAAKYGVQGFPTVLLMTPAGEVFGKTGYAPGGPEKYLASITTLRESGKKRVAEIVSLTDAFTNAKDDKDKAALTATALAMLADMKADDVGVEKVAEFAKGALTSSDAKVVAQAVTVLLKSGQADAGVQAKAMELDPKNADGLFELAVRGKMMTVQSDDAAKAFLAALDQVMTLGAKDKEVVTPMLINAVQWSHGPLGDKEGAKKWAAVVKKHVAGTADEAKVTEMVDRILAS